MLLRWHMPLLPHISTQEKERNSHVLWEDMSLPRAGEGLGSQELVCWSGMSGEASLSGPGMHATGQVQEGATPRHTKNMSSLTRQNARHRLVSPLIITVIALSTPWGKRQRRGSRSTAKHTSSLIILPACGMMEPQHTPSSAQAGWRKDAGRIASRE